MLKTGQTNNSNSYPLVCLKNICLTPILDGFLSSPICRRQVFKVTLRTPPFFRSGKLPASPRSSQILRAGGLELTIFKQDPEKDPGDSKHRARGSRTDLKRSTEVLFTSLQGEADRRTVRVPILRQLDIPKRIRCSPKMGHFV